jgi:hypothetical protein
LLKRGLLKKVLLKRGMKNKRIVQSNIALKESRLNKIVKLHEWRKYLLGIIKYDTSMYALVCNIISDIYRNQNNNAHVVD